MKISNFHNEVGYSFQISNEFRICDSEFKIFRYA